MTAWTGDDVKNLRIANVTDAELSVIRETLGVWRDRLPKNARRSLYYDTEQAFNDLGIAMPPQLRNAKFYLGWATQAVKKPAMRSQFDGLRLPGTDDPFELNEILGLNQFSLEFGQAVVSAYTHCMSLVTIAAGRPGEAPVQIQAHSAESSAALWDRRTRRISAAVTIAEIREDRPTEFVAWLPDVILECSYTPGGGWTAIRHPNRFGRVLAVPVLNDPQLRRPLGRSRLTNAVMALTDMAVRGYVRMEGNAEFYSSPQVAILNVAREAFGLREDEPLPESMKFKLAMDRLLALTKDADGDTPVLHQLSQASMQPHSDMLRTVAMAFAGETGIPPSSLGVIHDQPASAEAIRAAEHDLLIDVSYHNKHVHATSVREIATLAVMVRGGLSEPPKEAWKLSARFVDPEFRSLSAQADAVQKLAADMDSLVRHPVLLERIFDEDEARRIQDDARRARGVSTIQALAAARTGAPSEPSSAAVEAEDASALKAKADALGALIRAGVEPEDAASRTGLSGIRFTGATPVALRLPASDAAELEDR